MIFVWDGPGGLGVAQGANEKEAHDNLHKEIERLYNTERMPPDLGHLWHSFLAKYPGQPLLAVKSIHRPALFWPERPTNQEIQNDH